MTGSIFLLVALLIAAVSFALLIRRNLKHRDKARYYRKIFISTADDLIGKADLPDAHARQLLTLAGSPLGMGTRIMILILIYRAIRGHSNQSHKISDASFEKIPAHLLELYVRAIFAFIISDSYHSAIFGPIFRAANGWIFDGVREVKPDIRAHATRYMVDSVVHAEAIRIFRRGDDLACV